MCEETALMVILSVSAVIIVLVGAPILLRAMMRASHREIDELGKVCREEWGRDKEHLGYVIDPVEFAAKELEEEK